MVIYEEVAKHREVAYYIASHPVALGSIICVTRIYKCFEICQEFVTPMSSYPLVSIFQIH